MSATELFERLVREAGTAAIDGWSFEWLAGRATEERPPWGFARLLVDRLSEVSSVLDIQTGGGELLAEVLGRTNRVPADVAATEAWPPNVAVARRNLTPVGGRVCETGNTADLPFERDSFDLVISRHPVVIRWDEVERVLEPGGSYLAQHVGPRSNRELTEALMGPQPDSGARSGTRAAIEATAAGLQLVRLDEAKLRVQFDDIGAVVYFLRLVPWTVPGFDIDVYNVQLRALHDSIEAKGPFISHSTRFLIELRNS
jgi:SAM-dependent methyltransferase